MASVETRKLGKHLFIFEKGKAENANGKVKGRTLITSCQTDTDNNLPPEFIKYMRTLFDILDENNTGFVKLSDIEACWGHKNNASTVQGTEGVLEYLRKVTPANGLLSFDRLCMGFGHALHSKEVVSIPNGSPGTSSGRWKTSSNSGGSPAQAQPTEKRTRIPVSDLESDKQRKADVRLTSHGTRGSIAFRHSSDPDQNNHNPEQKRPESTVVELKQSARSFPCGVGSYDSSKLGSMRSPESSGNNTFGRRKTEEQNGSNLTGESNQPQRIDNLRSLCSKSDELNRIAQESDSKSKRRAFRTGQPSKKTVTPAYALSNSYPSNKTDQNSESNFVKAETVFLQRPGTRKRPKSMVPFSGQTQPADLSIAKKKGGILEGIQKTDKKAVVDKLKQWRSEQLKMKGSRSEERDFTKRSHISTHGYQSDNEGRYYRPRRIIAPVKCTGNKLDSEHHCSSTQSTSSNNGARVPRTTVYYQGEIQNNRRFTDHFAMIEESQEQSKAKNMENDNGDCRVTDQLHTLKEGLRVVDEVRNCLVKQIAELQEHKLYEQLNIEASPDSTRAKDPQSKTSAGRKNIGKTGVILGPAHIESLSSHFKDLKTILDQAKQSRKDH